MDYSKKDLENVSHSRLNGLRFVIDYLKGNSVKNLKVADLSAGSGFVAKLWADSQAEVSCFDLYPSVFKEQSLVCEPINLNDELPIEDNTFDYVILMETIEHIPDQLHLFQEISRILKPNGKLILTKPNFSSFAARLANLWTEGERSNMFLPNEHTLISYDNDRPYMGRFFLLGTQKLRSLAAIAGLEIERIHKNQLSNASLIFGVFLYPILYIRNILTLKRLIKEANGHTIEIKTLKKQFELNINPTVLFHKHTCIVLKKEVRHS